MKLLTLTMVSDLNNPGFLRLKKSLDYFGYDYRVIHNKNASQGGSGHPVVANWLKENRDDYTHFLFSDGFDTLALGPPSEVIERYKDHDYWLYSSEKACYPRSDWADLHEPCETPWRFINGGQFIVPIDLHLAIVERGKRGYENDQEWGMDNFLFRKDKIKIDTNCDIFQTIAFEAGDDFTYEETRLFNNKTRTYPTFVHGNGKTDMSKVYQLQKY